LFTDLRFLWKENADFATSSINCIKVLLRVYTEPGSVHFSSLNNSFQHVKFAAYDQ